MDHLDWVGYLIPAAIVVFTLLRRGSGAIKRAIDSAGERAAALQRTIEAQQGGPAIGAAASRTPAGVLRRPATPPAPPTRATPPRPPSAPRSPQTATISPVTPQPAATASGRSLLDALGNVASAQQAVILAEILAKPVALR